MLLGLLVSTRSARYDLLLRLTMLRLSGRLDCALSSLALASATREGASKQSFVYVREDISYGRNYTAHGVADPGMYIP